MFKDPNPKYLREIVPGQPEKMLVTCAQPGCDWKPKIVDRFIGSTSNYTSHYISKHKGIPTNEKQLQAALAAGRTPNQYFFDKRPKTNTEIHTDHQAIFRKLQLEFILKNNLSFRLLDQPTYFALFNHLSPSTTLYSSRTLIRDMKKEFDKGHEEKKRQLGEHIAGGGRIALTTDAWSTRNYHDYIAVTGHYHDKNHVHISLLLDIIRLKNPVHSGAYLAEVLCEVTDWYDITKAIISITRDNAGTNDTMLDEFQALVEERYAIMSDEDQAKYFLRFNRTEGDIRCASHIYNLAVNGALKALKAEAKENRHEYEHKPNRAVLSIDEQETKSRSALYKARTQTIIFQNRRLPRYQLIRQCKSFNIKYRRIPLDMPVRWSSTATMLKIFLSMKPAIQAVMATQQWDASVKQYLSLTDEDWDILEQLCTFFKIFVLPTTRSQADLYPTLHQTIPSFIGIIGQLKVFQLDQQLPILQEAAKAAWVIMDNYYKKSMMSRAAFVATVVNPRYKLQFFKWAFTATGGEQSPVYKKGKANFETVYSRYKQRQAMIRDWEREQEQAAEVEAPQSAIAQEDPDAWRDPFYGFTDERPHILKKEIDRYLDEILMERDDDENKVAHYWRSKEYDYELISQMARDFLAIPATSASSERVFSRGSDLITKKRNRLNGETTRWVLCLRDWGIIDEDAGEEPDSDNEEGDIIEEQEQR
jgi:hypothetical protein